MVNKNSILKFTARFVIFVLLTATVIASAVLLNLYGPSEKLYSDDTWSEVNPITPPGYDSSKYNVILDQHSHTIHSDGRLTVKQNIEWHIAMGYNTIVITDHNTLSHKADIGSLKEEYKQKGIIVILGMEWTTDRVHMNFLGLSSWDLPIPDVPTDAQIKEAITEAHNQGAVVTINHYPWSLNEAHMENHPTRQEALEWGIDYIEIINDDSSPDNVYDAESDSFCDQHSGIAKITGTDMHRPNDIGGGGVRGWTLINAAEFTEEAIMTELRAQRTEIIISSVPYEDQGTYADNPMYYPFKPFSDFGSLFIDLYYNGLKLIEVGAYVGYALGIFAIFEVYRFAKPKVVEIVENAKSKKLESTSE